MGGYWQRFEIVEDQDNQSGDEIGSDSDDGDIEMKDLEGRAAQNIMNNH